MTMHEATIMDQFVTSVTSVKLPGISTETDAECIAYQNKNLITIK